MRLSFGPPGRGKERDTGNEAEKQLRKGCVENADLILHPDDAQSTENTLEDDRKQCENSEPAEPASLLFDPEPCGENNREKSHCRCVKAVRMLIEDSSD